MIAYLFSFLGAGVLSFNAYSMISAITELREIPKLEDFFNQFQIVDRYVISTRQFNDINHIYLGNSHIFFNFIDYKNSINYRNINIFRNYYLQNNFKFNKNIYNIHSNLIMSFFNFNVSDHVINIVQLSKLEPDFWNNFRLSQAATPLQNNIHIYPDLTNMYNMNLKINTYDKYLLTNQKDLIDSVIEQKKSQLKPFIFFCGVSIVFNLTFFSNF